MVCYGVSKSLKIKPKHFRTVIVAFHLISGAKANPLYLVQVMTLKHCIRTLLGSLRLYAPVPAILSESQWAAWLDFALQLGSRH